MRLLVVSDLHYNLPQLDWVLEEAGRFELVVLAGDHLDLSSQVPLESQIVVVRTYVRRLAEITTTVVCSGNHDLTGRNEHGEKSAPWLVGTEVDGALGDWDTMDRDDVRVTVCPWWDGPATRADVASQLTRDAHDRPARWVWIYHYPPDGLPVSWVGSRHIGDADLVGWIDEHEPDLVVSGHIHDSPFLDGGSWLARTGTTWVVNPGRAPGPVPAHAVVDLGSGAASWWSPYGQDDQELWEVAG